MFYRIFDRHESVTHPSSRGPVPADVGESFIVISVRRAKRDLLDRLVEHEAAGLVVHHAQTVAAHVEDRSN